MPIDSEAVHTAAKLTKLAGSFEREARGWGDYPRVSAQCLATVDTLTHCARHVIQSGDITWGEAWVISAQLTLAHLSMARLFRDGTAWQDVPV